MPSRSPIFNNTFQRIYLTVVAMLLQYSVNSLFAQTKNNQPPNIIFFLVDDLGYTDVGVFAKHITGVKQVNQFYETPEIDQLAAKGLTFWQAYANPLCSPTRASVITGRYAGRLGFTTATGRGNTTFFARGLTTPNSFYQHDQLWADSIPIQQAVTNGYTNVALPAGQPGDTSNELTIAEALTGYQSYFIGKWHVGGHGLQGYQPQNQGFNTIAYFDAGSSPFYNWRNLWNNTKNPYPESTQSASARGNAGEPTGKDYLTDDLTEQALRTIEKHQKEMPGKPFFLEFAHFAVHAPLEAPKEMADYFEKKNTRGWNGHHNPVYAAMIKKLDESVGKVMRYLKEKGLDDNTMVVFMSDNGGVNFDLKNPKDSVTSNKPLKGGKATVFEGGIRVPLIIWQKGSITPGSSNVPVDCNDIFPTFMQVANQPYNSKPIDGKSLLPLLTDANNTTGKYTRKTFIWHYPLNVIVNSPDDGLPLTPHSAIRKGDYKLVFDWYGRLKLYNIKKDISETKNIALRNRGITRQLFGELIDWLDANVASRYLPKPNANYNPALEVRTVRYVDLYKAYHQHNDIIKLAHY